MGMPEYLRRELEAYAEIEGDGGAIVAGGEWVWRQLEVSPYTAYQSVALALKDPMKVASDKQFKYHVERLLGALKKYHHCEFKERGKGPCKACELLDEYKRWEALAELGEEEKGEKNEVF